MKTRRLAITFEIGRVDARRAHACGFVSRTMTRREGEMPVDRQLHFVLSNNVR
jgi:hypothetical protein